jgi:carboxyl-terminal processing protease
MNVKYAPIWVFLLVPLSAWAQEPGIDVTMPLVEQALSYARSHAIPPPSESRLLRAGAIRVCGTDLTEPGCKVPGVGAPGDGEGPEAAMAWRRVIESAMAGAAIKQGDAFDRLAFQRYVIDGMVAELDDPHSFFITPSVYRKLTAIPSDFTGFGMVVVPERDCLRVAAAHGGSPAAEAGLRGGERIVAVNGSPVTGFYRPAALAAVWGTDGERLEIVYVRGNQAAKKIRLVYRPWRFIPYEVTRRGEIAHVRISTFATGLAQSVGHQLSGSAGVVLDLRHATGGLEEEMVALADLLLGDAPIGSKNMRDELGSRTWSAAADSAGERLDLKVAVVTGAGTSGLAEVLASALRKSGRGILVGKQTAGRSTLETIRPLSDGSAIQVTTTRLLGPRDTDLTDGVLPHLATDRIGVVDLAVEILEHAAGPDLDALLSAARRAIGKP